MRSRRGLGASRNTERLFGFTRWLFYTLALIFFYMLMAGGMFRGWQPFLIIPLAVAVSMREGELGGAVFAAVCGFVIDIACGRLFGFSGLWLVPGCVAAALAVSHLIRLNLLNFIWLNAAVCALMGAADFFFGYVLWDAPHSSLIFFELILPSHLSAIALSAPVYFLVKAIRAKFSPQEEIKVSANKHRGARASTVNLKKQTEDKDE